MSTFWPPGLPRGNRSLRTRYDRLNPTQRFRTSKKTLTITRRSPENETLSAHPHLTADRLGIECMPGDVQKPPISRASQTAPRRAAVAHQPATEQHVEPSLAEPSRSENDTPGDTPATHAGTAREPVPPIDWHSEIEASARALEQHEISRAVGARSPARNSPSRALPPQKPACPYEKCEPGWGEDLGIFKPSLHSKVL
jgi:hypothetical protein